MRAMRVWRLCCELEDLLASLPALRIPEALKFATPCALLDGTRAITKCRNVLRNSAAWPQGRWPFDLLDLEEGPTLPECLAFMQRPWQVLKVEERRSGTQKIPWRHGRKTFWDQVFSSVQWSLKQSIFWQTRMQVARLQWQIPIFGAKRLYLVAVFFLHIFSCWI